MGHEHINEHRVTPSMGVTDSDPKCLQRSDAELIREAQNGDRAAFTALVQRYSNAILVAALSFSRDSHDAEDIAQDVFTTAYIKLHQLRDPERVGPWLYQIARRTATRRYRNKAREADILTSQSDGRAEPASDTISWAEISEYLRRLTENARTVLFLRYLAD